MTNIYSVTKKKNFLSLLEKFKSNLIVTYIYNNTCDTNEFIKLSKINKNIIFVLLNIDNYDIKTEFTNMYISYFLNLKNIHNDTNILNIQDNINLILEPKNFIQETKDTTYNEESIKEELINKILSLENILNKMCMYEIKKLNSMKKISSFFIY